MLYEGVILKIEINNVSKSFGEKQVLKNITFTAIDGEILCLLGPSGSGKTTLIRLITGSLECDAGEVIIDGIKVPHISLMKNIGFMPQSDALYLDISGYDNMLFFGRLFGLYGKLLKQRAEELFTLVDLSNESNKLVINYSGGMKKRLSLAIALLHNPEILILDEPTVGIDPVIRRVIWNQFELLRQQGKIIIVSTHVMDEAERCQQAALIYNGNLIAHDKIENLKTQTKSGSIEELFFTAKEIGVNL